MTFQSESPGLLTEFAFHTVKYYDQDLAVWTELARPVRKDRGLNILQYEKQTRLIDSLVYVRANFSDNPPNILEIYQQFAERVFSRI